MMLLRVLLCLILFSLIINQSQAQVVESVDTRDLKSLDIRHEGSSPSFGTINAAVAGAKGNANAEASVPSTPAWPATAAPFSKWWVTMPLTSWHKSDKPYNERNWGLGLEYKKTETWSWVGGTYRNSFYEQTYYAGGAWTPLKFEIQEVTIKGGFLLGFFSGYKNKVIFLTPPVIQIEAFKKWGGDILVGDGFVGLSLKFNKGVLE